MKKIFCIFIILLCINSFEKKAELPLNIPKAIEPVLTCAIPVSEAIIIEEKEGTNVFAVTADERDTLAKLVYLEARGENMDCKKAIVSVVFNRINSPFWGDTVDKVVHAKNQFTPAKYISTTTANDECYEAVDYVLKNGCTIPEYILYFRADHFFSWATNYEKIDTTCFSYVTQDKDNFLAGEWGSQNK